MSDPKLPAAKRRLAALLRDEEYGPKLARLPRQDERTVLDLVYENKGLEARRAINDLDVARRDKRTLGGKAREYARLSRPDRRRGWHRIMDEVNGKESKFWGLYRSAVLAS